jgi:hypothetical protein
MVRTKEAQMARRILFKPCLKYFILTYVLPAVLQNMSSAAYNFRISFAKLYKRIDCCFYQSFESNQKPFFANFRKKWCAACMFRKISEKLHEAHGTPLLLTFGTLLGFS